MVEEQKTQERSLLASKELERMKLAQMELAQSG